MNNARRKRICKIADLHWAVDARNHHERGGWLMLSDLITDLIRAKTPKEKEVAYRRLEKLGVDRFTADVAAEELRKEVRT